MSATSSSKSSLLQLLVRLLAVRAGRTMRFPLPDRAAVRDVAAGPVRAYQWIHFRE